MLHVMIAQLRLGRRRGQQVIAFLWRDRASQTVRLSKAPMVYVEGNRSDAEDLCAQRGWKVERFRRGLQ
jgi:lipoate-protein ligase B